ncbi:hypothetical protein MMC07_000069 [Pseudocyphellaria aurata]|nr:hypothetical protein [Pseudocyphellaria aurata]
MSVATVNDHLPNGTVNHWDAGDDDESTPRSSSLDDNQNETMEIPFHGSCPKCHHLHTNRPFTIFTDSTKHSRFQCDACQHHILGIGRASTQTTLASVESIPVQSNRHNVTSRPSNLQNCVNAPPQASTIDSPVRPDQLNNTSHLSTITEANTLNGGSRSPSYRQAGVSVSPRRGNSPSPQANGALAAQERLGEDGKAPIRYPPFKIKSLFRRGKERLLSKSGKLKKIFGFRSKNARTGQKHSQDLKDSPPNPPAGKISSTDARATSVHFETNEIQLRGRSTPIPSSLAAENPEVVTDLPSEAVHDETRPTNLRQLEAEEAQDPTGNAVEAEARDPTGDPSEAGSDVDEDQRVATQKREKIRARRREATLKSEALRKPSCHCGAGCHCLGDGGESDRATEGHIAPSPIPISEVPDHSVLGPLANPSRSNISETSHGNTRLFLSGIGAHINPSQVYTYAQRRISIAENSSSTADSNRRQADRLSQDTTAWGSSDSSISLTVRRPSASPNIAMAHRSSVLNAVQNYDDSIRHGGPSQGRENVELSTREREVALNGPNAVNSDEIATRLANNSNLGPRQERRQTPSNRTSISSDDANTGSSMEQLENQERTPRPYSYDAAANDSPSAVMGPSPDRISTALAPLAAEQNDAPNV